MDELAFLSAEVDNESENLDDESDLNTSRQPSDKDNEAVAPVSKVEEPEASDTGGSSGQETVEICQSTVNPNNRVNSENFKIQRVIGKGGYGKVFLVQKVDGVDQGKLYAMKVLKKARLICNEKDKAHTVSERNILEMLRHPFLVKLHYAFQNHSNLYIVLEYCPGGELFNHLEREGALLENAACFYTAEIVLAIGHLHSLGIIYRDLKSENVLLDRQGHVKLTDFGLSKEGVCTTNTFCGTIEYMAPEIIRGGGHGKAVDWWSLGTLLYDMLSGGPPFSQEDSREATTLKILTAPIKFPPTFSPEVMSLIRGLLRRDPRERLGSKGDVEEVKKHRFFRRHDINWSDVFHRRLRPPFKPKLSSDNDVSMFDPTFTRLQPVVSPSDPTRSIPPDMFQGFSYVAPSVCEDAMREPWIEPQSSSQRKHSGTRGSQSAGRLRRLGAPTIPWSARASEIVQQKPNAQLCHSKKSIAKGFDMPNGFSGKPQSTLSAITDVPKLPIEASKQDQQVFMPFATSVLPDTSGQSTLSNVESFTVQEEDEDNVDMDEDDEDLEEENVPGAQEILKPTMQRIADPRPNVVTLPRPNDTFRSNPSFDRIPTFTHTRSANQLRSMYTGNLGRYRQGGLHTSLFPPPSSTGTNVPQPATNTNSGAPSPATTSSGSKCTIM